MRIHVVVSVGYPLVPPPSPFILTIKFWSARDMYWIIERHDATLLSVVQNEVTHRICFERIERLVESLMATGSNSGPKHFSLDHTPFSSDVPCSLGTIHLARFAIRLSFSSHSSFISSFVFVSSILPYLVTSAFLAVHGPRRRHEGLGIGFQFASFRYPAMRHSATSQSSTSSWKVKSS